MVISLSFSQTELSTLLQVMHARELRDLALTELGLECSVQDSLQDASTPLYEVLCTLFILIIVRWA